MTSVRIAGPSRAASSRTGSVAREILKRRDKPYKTEKAKVLAKKKRLDLHTSYRPPPPGYTFLPVGTPDLAERCKELSRQRSFAVNVVNAKPVTKYAQDPEKVSHHVHRIGYHFRAQIVEEACAELGYTIRRGRFVKEADLQAQHEQNRMAQILARHGVQMNQQMERETPTQVRAAIKELFPRIPEEDLEQIVQHAWEKDSRRVGTNATLDLPRRVQLAVIARIRHTYTDYDFLLKAFEWKEARRITEPGCLQKLIEWRGEHDDENDNELEEIVRETIVIDDDDVDDTVNGSEADDEDSAAELGDTSDGSIEFTHELAADEDLGAESVDETSKNFATRPQQWQRRVEAQNNIARQKIGAARQQLRNGPPPRAPYGRLQDRADHALTGNRNAPPLHLRAIERREAPDAVRSAAQVFCMEEAPRPLPYQQPFVPAYATNDVRFPTQNVAPPAQPSPYYSHPSPAVALHDRPVQSIEPGQRTATMLTSPYAREQYYSSNGHGQGTPDAEHYEKRRRVEYIPSNLHHQSVSDNHRPAYQQPLHYIRTARTPPTANNVIDLTTPEQPVRSLRRSPPSEVRMVAPTRLVERLQNGPDERRMSDNGLHYRSPVGPTADRRPSLGQYYQRPVEPVPYDPRQPLLAVPEYEQRVIPQTTHPEPYQGYPTAHPQPAPRFYELPPGESAYSPHVTRPVYASAQHQQVVYRLPQGHYVPAPAPPPVHGAPAPIQQVPRDVPGASNSYAAAPHSYHPAAYHQPQTAITPAPPPMNGAPHPAQYFNPR